MPQIISQSDFIPYKFKDLKVYCSTEWLAGNRKKYRQVFEQRQVSYIYVELSLINKLYDTNTWDAVINLKCFQLDQGKKEVCSVDISRQISKHDHIIYIREGWGHKTIGSFWTRGKYCWEAYIDGKKLSTKYFYIEDIESANMLPAEKSVRVDSISFFEGDYDQGEEEEERTYYTCFSSHDTKYVFVEMMLENRLQKRDWYCELFIKFYNNARELKGEVIRLQKIKKGEDILRLTAGWGSNVKGSWRAGTYTVEIVFQETLIAQSTFEIGEEFEVGQAKVLYPGKISDEEVAEQIASQNPQNVFRELNALVGLRNIKKQIHEHTQYIKFLRLRNDRGFKDNERIALHSVFTGNPGTGKTTIARMLGTIYHHMGVLEKGHVHEVDRVDLVGEFIGQTAPKVREAIDKARGGVLFIDEAYSLARTNEDSKDFGREVIELLVKEMSQPSCNFMVVAAGYPEEMKTFIHSNPGLKSRFKYHYEFEDFTLNELIDIAEKFCTDQEILMSDSARDALIGIIQEAFRNRDQNFGNARYVGQLIEQAKINMGIRLMGLSQPSQMSDQELRSVRLQDVLKLKEETEHVRSEIEIDHALLKDATNRLDSMIGLDEIKEKVHQLIEVVKFRKRQPSPAGDLFNMHTVFVGNPGTGKTTVARILTDIFKAIGLLSKGHIIETDRQGLVAGYVGQTAIKTAELIEKARGGVLFIDEAYSLNKAGANNDFGDEAIQVLLKQMEDLRGEFFVFVAGYPEKMDSFLKMNPGLKSRFDHYLHFKDFNDEELLKIAMRFFDESDYKISTSALDTLSVQLVYENERRDRQFGFARRVRTYVAEIIRQQNLRLSTERRTSSPHYTSLIKKVDVEQAIRFIDREFRYIRNQIGFGKEST